MNINNSVFSALNFLKSIHVPLPEDLVEAHRDMEKSKLTTDIRIATAVLEKLQQKLNQNGNFDKKNKFHPFKPSEITNLTLQIQQLEANIENMKASKATLKENAKAKITETAIDGVKHAVKHIAAKTLPEEVGPVIEGLAEGLKSANRGKNPREVVNDALKKAGEEALDAAKDATEAGRLAKLKEQLDDNGCSVS